jgi:hypothetical protein
MTDERWPIRQISGNLQKFQAVINEFHGLRRRFHPTAYRIPRHGHIVTGLFTPVLAKHSKSFSLIDRISVGVDRMQRNFEPMRKQVEQWQRSELTDVTAKVVIYEAFVEGKLEAPKHLARTVHDLYFEPRYEEFRPRTIWSLSNAFTSAFKELDPIPQFKATAKLGEFLEARFLGVVLGLGAVRSRERRIAFPMLIASIESKQLHPPHLYADFS